mmetsp:Transcript_17026/g.53519  ORF Transcript_17026/g.53519 Transcript_17026/m.53519 type:complete len:463 (-) Transcript_17026:1098-2486(-)
MAQGAPEEGARHGPQPGVARRRSATPPARHRAAAGRSRRRGTADCSALQPGPGRPCPRASRRGRRAAPRRGTGAGASPSASAGTGTDSGERAAAAAAAARRRRVRALAGAQPRGAGSSLWEQPGAEEKPPGRQHRVGAQRDPEPAGGHRRRGGRARAPRAVPRVRALGRHRRPPRARGGAARRARGGDLCGRSPRRPRHAPAPGAGAAERGRGLRLLQRSRGGGLAPEHLEGGLAGGRAPSEGGPAPPAAVCHGVRESRRRRPSREGQPGAARGSAGEARGDASPTCGVFVELAGLPGARASPGHVPALRPAAPAHRAAGRGGGEHPRRRRPAAALHALRAGGGALPRGEVCDPVPRAPSAVDGRPRAPRDAAHEVADGGARDRAAGDVGRGAEACARRRHLLRPRVGARHQWRARLHGRCLDAGGRARRVCRLRGEGPLRHRRDPRAPGRGERRGGPLCKL